MDCAGFTCGFVASVTNQRKYAATVPGFDLWRGLYAGGVSGISLITKNFDRIQEQSIYLFTVGAADVANTQNIANIRSTLDRTLSPHMLQKMKIYHFRGGMDYPKMSFAHRAMMGIRMNGLKRKDKSQLDDEQMQALQTYGQLVDFYRSRHHPPRRM